MTKLKGILASAFLVSIPFAAEADPTTYTFDSVTQLQYVQSADIITGTLAGNPSPVTVTVPEQFSNCEPIYREMLSTQGKYLLSVTLNTIQVPEGGQSTVLQNCSLQLKP